MFALADKAKYSIIAVLAVLLFLTQCHSIREINRLEGQIAAMEIEAQQAEIEAMDRQRETERKWQERANDAVQTVRREAEETEAQYDRAIQELYELIADRDAGMATGGLPDGEDSDADHGAALPQDAGSAAGTGRASKNRCRGTDAESLKRLSERALTVARDCDITARRYNELLRLWKEAKGD